jgi:hypothetical protein
MCANICGVTMDRDTQDLHNLGNLHIFPQLSGPASGNGAVHQIGLLCGIRGPLVVEKKAPREQMGFERSMG